MDNKNQQASPILGSFARTIAAGLNERTESEPRALLRRPEASLGATAATTIASVPARGDTTGALKLLVKGLKPMERQLLDGIVRVSQRRSPKLALLADDEAAWPTW